MKIAIIGTWHVHTDEYAKAVVENEKSELVCAYDPDPTRGKVFAQKYDIPFISDYNEILCNEEIEGVVISTATNEHPEVIKAAAKSGKHIFTEKVFAFTTKEAEEMACDVDKFGGKFTIALFHRTLSKVICLKELQDSGVLGEITYMRVRNVHNGSIAGWLPPHFYDKEQCGGGAMMDLGAHPMYLLDWFMGEPISINSIFTSVTGKPVEDNAVCTIEFANGAIGVSETGFVSSNYPYMIELSGTKGGAMIVGETVSYCCEKTENKWVTIDNLPENMPRPIHLWIDAVKNDTDAPFTTKDAINLTKLMEGAYISHEKGIKHIY